MEKKRGDMGLEWCLEVTPGTWTTVDDGLRRRLDELLYFMVHTPPRSGEVCWEVNESDCIGVANGGFQYYCIREGRTLRLWGRCAPVSPE